MRSLTLGSVDEQVFQALNAHYSGTLELVAFYEGLSTTRVFHVRMPVSPDLQLKIDRVIKVFRHDEGNIAFPNLDVVFQQEIRSMMAISHTNIASIYSAGTLPIDFSTATHFYVMEYVPEAKELDYWLSENLDNLRGEHIIEIFLQIANGLQALHQAGILHCDLNFRNLVVGKAATIKITDLGFSKIVWGRGSVTAIDATLENLPNRYKNFVRELRKPRRVLLEIPRDHLDQTFDLHFFGRLLKKTLAFPEISAKLDPLDIKSLELIAERTDLDIDSRLPRYMSADQIISDLRKLRPGYLNRPGIRELSAYTGTRTIRIPITGSIPFTPRVEKVIAHPLFMRLHSALQLGFSYYIFPGAAHTRFEHSLGVFANVTKYINSLLSDDYQPYFRQVIDEEKILTTLLCGLIHDVGQNSFAHSLEDLGLVPPHEAVSSAFITGEGIEDLVPDRFLTQGPLSTVLKAAWPEVDIPRLQWIITGERPSGMPSDIGWEIMQSIINGPIDADKTDYLLRDAHHAGVEYARSIDVTRFMNSLTAAVVRENLTSRGVLAITWKGAQSAENIILARSQMFWVLYWHHAVRSAQGTMGECCYEHLQNADAEIVRRFKQTLYCGTVGELLALLENSHSQRARYLATLLRHRRLYKRSIDLDYRDDQNLYLHLSRLRDHFTKQGDLLLRSIAQVVADASNKWLAQDGSSTRLTAENIMVDVPKANKDALGAIYVVDRNSIQAREYTSRGLLGTTEDWQNRVRTIRIFVSPEIDRGDREIIRKYGRKILESL